MAIVIGLIAGMVVLGIGFGGAGAMAGALLGGFIGLLVWGRPGRKRAATAAAGPASAAPPALADRVVMLEQRVAELERALNIAAPASPVAKPEPPAPAVVRAAPEPGATETVAPLPVVQPEPLAAIPGVPPAPPNPLWAWIVGGNTFARVGVLLLLIGVGFLLKYAVEHVSVPISMRLALVAAGAIVLLVIGWRLRERRRAYAMVLQGGGVGILYLTVYAALRLYALLPPVATFGLLVWICAMSSWLAIRQDAISLAVIAVIGGFMAPILTSSQAGDHVMLFGYYALLNAGILGIAWFKAWRPLNVLGFAFTFVVGTAWGVARYRPEDFATTEPFLVLFFLYYLAIAVLYALRRQVEVRDYVDGALVFGTPLVAAGLQSALVRHIEFGMAISALAMAAVYLVLARVLFTRRRDDLRLLVESFLALGVGFATLAIPLALDARWTSAAWAVEGAAIVWVGVRQQHMFARIAGCLLELAAGFAFLSGFSLWPPASAPLAYPLVNSVFVGAVLVALAGLFTARILHHAREQLTGAEHTAASLAFAWGLLWWLSAASREIDRFAPADYRLAAMVLMLTGTALAFAILESRLRWTMARIPVLALLPLLLAVALVWSGDRGGALFAYGGFLAWPLAIGALVALLRAYDRPRDEVAALPATIAEAWHAGLFLLVVFIVAHEAAWAGARIAKYSVWHAAPWALVPALALAAVGGLVQSTTWPVGAHRLGYLVFAGVPVAAALALWSLAASVIGAGDPSPLPYIPIVNPLDLTQAIVLVALAMWLVRARSENAWVARALPAGAAVAVVAALAFVWINAIALRTLHFAYDIPYSPRALWGSTLVQAVLSLLWSTIALATMALANRRQWRVVWIAGAVLLGAVVVKLFFVELAQTGTITRIVSFIGVGLLLLLIGYLAPVPPRRKEGPA